jgi:hypothetical protein
VTGHLRQRQKFGSVPKRKTKENVRERANTVQGKINDSARTGCLHTDVRLWRNLHKTLGKMKRPSLLKNFE